MFVYGGFAERPFRFESVGRCKSDIVLRASGSVACVQCVRERRSEVGMVVVCRDSSVNVRRVAPRRVAAV